MCDVNSYDIILPSGTENGSSGGWIPFSTTSYIYELESLGQAIKFIDNWLRFYEDDYG